MKRNRAALLRAGDENRGGGGVNIRAKTTRAQDASSAVVAAKEAAGMHAVFSPGSRQTSDIQVSPLNGQFRRLLYNPRVTGP